MKQFLIKFFCFLAVLALILLGLGAWYNHLSPVSHEMASDLEHMPESIDLAVVGSSHAMYGIKLAPYSENYFSFAMPGQTPRYDARMLKQFEDRIADGATVILDVSYMSPFWTEPDHEFLEKQTRYYRVLSKENIVDYDAKEAFRIRLTDSLPAARILYTDISTLLNAFMTAKPEPAEENPVPQDADIPGWWDDIPHQQDVLRKKHQGLITPVFPDMNPAMQKGYEEILAMAQAHNWRVIAVTTPFSQSYSDIYDQEFFRVFYDHIQTLFLDQGIEYWDFSHDPEFLNSHDYFVDLDHLSPAGAERFSAILAEKLGLSK